MKAWLMHSIVAAFCLMFTLLLAGMMLANWESGNETVIFIGVVMSSAIVVGFATSWMAEKTPIPVSNRDAVRAVANYRRWMANADSSVVDAETRAMLDVLREFAIAKMEREEED